MIVVSLTTIPERLEKGLPCTCIKSIIKQTLPVDAIIINIPLESSKGKKYPSVAAKYLETLGPLVRVNFCPKDLGPITKLIPTLDLLNNSEALDIYIILVDDDCIYAPHMVENLVTWKKKFPMEKVIGTAGRIKQGGKLEFVSMINYNPLKTIGNHIYVDVIETFAGVLYDYSLFKNTNFIEWVSGLPDYVLLADDIVLSKWAKKRGAKLCKIIQDSANLVAHDPKDTTELRTLNDFNGNNERVYDYFVESNEELQKLLKACSDNSFTRDLKRRLGR